MKILIISEYWHPDVRGGGEKSAQLLAEAVSKHNDVTVLTSKTAKPAEDKLKVLRFLNTGKNPSSFLSNIKRFFVYEKSLLGWLEKNLQNYDVVHCMNMTSMPAVKLKNRFPNVLFVAHINSYLSFCPKGDLMFNGSSECWKNCTWHVFNSCFSRSEEFGKLKNRFYYKYNPCFRRILYKRYKSFGNLMLKFDVLTPISRYVKERIAKTGFRNKIFVIPNIVELQKSKKKFSYKLPVNIAYLGTLSRAKGIDVLLQSLKGLNDYQLNIYGSGQLKKWILKYSAENSLNVKIHDFTEDVSSIYMNSDLIVFPSVWPEPFGRIAIEAAAYGVPIIASSAGGIKEILPKECLFKSENELRAKISKFIVQYGKKKRMFMPKINLKNYSGQEIANKLKNIYKK